MVGEGKLFDTFNELLEKAINQATELKQGKDKTADGKWSYWGYPGAHDMPFHMRNVTRFYGFFIDPILRGYIDILYPELLLNPKRGNIQPYITEEKNKKGLYTYKRSDSLPKGYDSPDSSNFESQLGAKDEFLTVDFQKDFLQNKILVSTDFDKELQNCSPIQNKKPNSDIIQLKNEFDKYFKEIGESDIGLILYTPTTTTEIIRTDSFIFTIPTKPKPTIQDVIYKSDPINETPSNTAKKLEKIKYGRKAIKQTGIMASAIKFGSPFYMDKIFNEDNIENLGTQNGWELYLKCRVAYVKLWNQYWDWNPRVTIGKEPGSELLYGFRTVNFKKDYGEKYDWTKIDSEKENLQDFIFQGETLTKEQLGKLIVNNKKKTNPVQAKLRLVTNNIKLTIIK